MSLRLLLPVALCAALFMACSSVTPEEQAAKAAKSYYDLLVDGQVETFLEGKVGSNSLPNDYMEQLVKAHRQYLSDIKEKHGGLREVLVSPNVAHCDSSLHLTYAFLLLCYGDSAQEEVTVPMVEVDGEWRMK